MFKRIPITIIVVVLLTACATPPASPPATIVPTRTMTTLPTETSPPTSTPTPEPTATSTETPKPTVIETPTPTPESIVGNIDELIAATEYKTVVAMLQQAVNEGEYDSMQEAITEVLLPIFREQTVYSDQAFERIVPDFASVEVNGQGQLQVLDADGDVLIEKTVPGTSNLEWAIPIIKLAYGIEEVGIIDGEEVNEEEEVLNRFTYFEQGWVKESLGQDGLYNFYGVLDSVVQLETPFKLPTGEVITTLARVYYLDAQGVQQMIYVPFFSYDEQRMIWHTLDGESWKENVSTDQFNSMIEAIEVAALEKNGGPRTMAGRPKLKVGQILFLGFNITVNPELSAGAKEMFADAMSFYTQAQIDEFARTGDPSVLPEVSGYGPLLILLDGNEVHRLTKYQNN